MKLFINAGGKGKRLYPLTKDLPKPLVEVCGEPVLFHLVEWAKKYGIDEIVMMNGHMSEKIINYFGNGDDFGVKITHSNEPYALGSGGALKFAKKHINERFVYISGDHICDVDLKKMIDFHEKNDSKFTALVHKSSHPDDSDLLVSDDESKVVRFVSKHDEHIDVGDLSNSGLCIIEPEIIDIIDSIDEEVFNFENDLYPLILDKGLRFFSYQTQEFMADMGTVERLRKCEDYLKDRKNNLCLDKKIKAVILIGGLGKRFRPLTETVPKPMVEINGKPFLEFKIESLKKEGIKDIVLCVSHLGNIVEEYFGDGKRFGVNIEYSYERESLLGTAGAIKNAENLLEEVFIVMNGDTFIDINLKQLLGFHETHDSQLTMVVSNATHPETQELVEVDEDIVSNIYKRETSEHEDYLLLAHKPLVNGGIYVIDKNMLNEIPVNQHASMEKDIFPKKTGQMKGFLHEGYMLDIADESDFREFKKDVKQGLIMPSVTGYQKTIRSRSPVRITFGGGGTDISPYDQNHGGVCINATINRYVYCSLKLRDDKKINIKSDIINLHGGFETYEDSFDNVRDIEVIEEDTLKLIKAVLLEMNPCYGFDLYVRSEIPPHSGLGASASLSVSIIGIFNHLRKKDRLSRHEIAEKAFEIERDRLGNSGGRQDQYATVFGGINFYEFGDEKNVKVNPVEMNKNDLLELEKNLLIVSSGRRAKSSGNIHKEETEKGFFEKEDKVKRLHEIKESAIETEFNLRRGNLKRFGELIVMGWERKKQFNPDVSSAYIDALIEEARVNGAIGARLMGAGGGGHLLIYSNPDKEHKIREVLAERGAKSIDFSFDFEGLRVWEVEE
jgi:D-glycero-alpha-D-manno-heptose-7-phosphate kinase